ncbi:NTP pyrophosphohydrolase [Paenibacillus albidus]|uniref:NAD(+) diphosphatase n=1 Tax=Paenibacillus albidus TaxID=2041023 RepID=A0A917FQS5_9BACL|nr:NUDIX domain-containing protein [Paenibacillus albidus]GGG00359.1 NTP pyrophosphohydrolase [Paenibacillus albidus]
MKYCHECGTELLLKDCNGEGEVPFCKACGSFRFPVFSTAVSTAVLNKEMNKILLIKQYNRPDYILLAGYVNKGEDAESTVVREVKEEVGLDIISYQYMRSLYFEPSNTLMLNFISVADSEDLSRMDRTEVDDAAWFTFEEAARNIKKNSLAETFLLAIIKSLDAGKVTLQPAAVKGD